MRSDSSDSSSTKISCSGCCLLNFLIGWWLFDYSLMAVFGKDIPWYADVLCGIFIGSALIPVALVCWVMELCGVPTPFVK